MNAQHDILLVGASGFIGRHLHAALLAAGYRVLASARRPDPQAPGEWLALDLNRLDEFVWPAGIGTVINASGLLTTDPASITALQQHASIALGERAAREGARLLQVSALGADPAADTPFLASKGVADARLLALDLPAVVLRPSLVLGPGAASSRWLQQLSPWPVIPLLDNHARLQPLHVDDLCAAVLALLRQWPAQSCVLPVVGPEAMTQGQLLDRLRAAQGWAPARYWVLSGWLARPAALLGDRLGWQRLNTQTLTLARRDNLASPEPLAAVCGQRCLPLAQRLHAWPAPAVSAALALQPLLLGLLVLLWLGTAVASLGPGWDWGLRILAEAGLDGWLARGLVVSGALCDAALGIGLLLPRWRRLSLQLQIGLMLVYMLLISLLLPHYWADPLQSVGKNLILLPATLWLLWLTPPARSRR
jgi:uncharacterized protein YbjT (DUF2867 family)